MNRLSSPAVMAALFLSALGPMKVKAQSVVDSQLELTTWASGLSQPTNFEFLPTAPNDPLEVLVLEKATGKVIHVIDGVLQAPEALDLAVNFRSERGLLGIALHPNFTDNNYVYLYYTPSSTGSDSNVQNSALNHRVERWVWSGAVLTFDSLILTLPVFGGPNHDGGIILFGPDDKLYGVIGDLNHSGQLQNQPLGALPDDTGIIFRVNDDGSAPSDNPFFALGGAMQKVYAYGVRNCFGMDFDPLTNALWDTENGPSSYDEINRVDAGLNSGWNRIMGPDSRDPQGVGDLWVAAGSHYSDPEFSWLSPVGVTSIHFIESDVLGTHLQHQVFVGDNNTGLLHLFEPTLDRTGLVMPDVSVTDLVADNSTERNLFLFGSGFGVITDIDTAPDGVYICSIGGNIYRLSRRDTSDVDGLGTRSAYLSVQPNPMRRSTTLRYRSASAARFEARIYDPAGRLVRVLFGDTNGVDWDGRDMNGETLAAGVYLVRAGAGAALVQSKIIRIR